MDNKIGLFERQLSELKQSKKAVEVILRGACCKIGPAHIKSIECDTMSTDYLVVLEENPAIFFVSDIVAILTR